MPRRRVADDVAALLSPAMGSGVVAAADAGSISAAPQLGQNRPDSSVFVAHAEHSLTRFERSSPAILHDIVRARGDAVSPRYGIYADDF
ncbi:MAG: hypothetical protein HOV81_26290 [Kofleriaceae bacterium]|nr:hypothetical protein [Kofleriaceae bacterium]